MMLEFQYPIPVVVEGDKEGYAIYVTNGGQFENDIWCVTHCLGGIVRHYRSDQIRIHGGGTFNITKEDKINNNMNNTKKILIEREALESLEKKIAELEISPGVYSQGIAAGIKLVIDYLEEKNVYKSE